MPPKKTAAEKATDYADRKAYATKLQMQHKEERSKDPPPNQVSELQLSREARHKAETLARLEEARVLQEEEQARQEKAEGIRLVKEARAKQLQTAKKAELQEKDKKAAKIDARGTAKIMKNDKKIAEARRALENQPELDPASAVDELACTFGERNVIRALLNEAFAASDSSLQQARIESDARKTCVETEQAAAAAEHAAEFAYTRERLAEYASIKAAQAAAAVEKEGV
jgi:hypothetical protein